MKKLTTAVAAFLAATAVFFSPAENRLVILHTNDTHSSIEPDAKGAGGILQRKAVFDSVRSVEKNVIIADAGDGVQGSLYFKFFRGETDYPLLDMLGYDLRILGNHEFDNGLDDLAQAWQKVSAKRLSSNYDFSKTSAKGIFEPWTIRKVAGKKIGFIGINIDPKGLIVEGNYRGMVYRDALSTADSLAAMLKHTKGCDLVVALTHIGYSTSHPEGDDLRLAAASHDIDIIIGGHSHTLVNPSTMERTSFLINNADGRPVLVAQTGKGGRYVGRIALDLDNLSAGAEAFDYSLIPVTDRFTPSQLDKRMVKFLEPYKQAVDSVNSRRVGEVRGEMNGDSPTGSFANWVGDFGQWYGNLIADSLSTSGNNFRRPDLAIMNVGGIRNSWQPGPLTEGMVLATFPFSNHFVITDIKGSDLLEALRVAAAKGGEAVSNSVKVTSDDSGNLLHAFIAGQPLDPEKVYRLATIDYLAWGNDGLATLANGTQVFEDDIEISAPYLRYLRMLDDNGLPVEGESVARFVKSTH